MSLLVLAFFWLSVPPASPVEPVMIVPAGDQESRDLTARVVPGTNASGSKEYPSLRVPSDAVEALGMATAPSFDDPGVLLLRTPDGSAAWIPIRFGDGSSWDEQTLEYTSVEDSRLSLSRSEISQAALRGGLWGAAAGGALGLILGWQEIGLAVPRQGGPDGEDSNVRRIDTSTLATGAFAGWMIGTSLGSHLGNDSRGNLAENLVVSWGFSVMGILISKRFQHQEFYIPFAAFQLLSSSATEWESARNPVR